MTTNDVTNNTVSTIVDEEILKRVIEREKKQKMEEEKKAFLEAELAPEKFGPAKEIAEHFHKSGLLKEIFERSPELDVLAEKKDAVKLRDAVLKRGAELVALKEKEAEAARIKAELEEKAKQQTQPAAFDGVVRPVSQQPANNVQDFISPYDKDFAQKLKEAGVRQDLIDLAVLTSRDY